jgi:crotonobetainyl-CoA:carnitine CoA-transferase CaiB-like acyl-CoA transferase
MAGCLDGIRVIDLGRYQAGPRCSLILGDLGAEVIKVEAAPDGDESRRLGMVYWSQYNRGKKKHHTQSAQRAVQEDSKGTRIEVRHGIAEF